MDIYSANFVPITSVENAIQSFGTISFNSELARVNQLLFLQDQGLNILNGLYSCETFEDLSICLSLCMPICLDILEELNYSTELKAHVRNMLNYFWDMSIILSSAVRTLRYVSSDADIGVLSFMSSHNPILIFLEESN